MLGSSPARLGPAGRHVAAYGSDALAGFKDGALTYSLSKATGGIKVTHKGQNRQDLDHQGTRSGCFWLMQIHLERPLSPPYRPRAGADGSGKKPLPLSRASATLQWDKTLSLVKKLLGFVVFGGTFFSFLSSFCSGFSSLTKPAKSQRLHSIHTPL